MPDRERPLRIGDLARRTGVSVDALRFYERRGLIPRAEREASSGYRVYPPDILGIVRFVREAQTLGFSLAEVGELLRLRGEDASCADVRRAAQAKLDDVERRLAGLRRVRSALRRLVETCRTDGSMRDCPILEALGGAEDGVRA